MIVKINHKGDKKTYDIDKDTLTLGRGSSADIHIDSQFVSREHLEISKDHNEDIYIKDISSNNWVSYNGEPIDKNQSVQYFAFAVLMLPGDHIIEISNSAAEVELPSHDKSSLSNPSIMPTSGRKQENSLASIDKNMEEKLLLATLNSEMKENSSSDPKKKIYYLIGVVALAVLGLMFLTNKTNNIKKQTADNKNKTPQASKTKPKPKPKVREVVPSEIKTTDYDIYSSMRSKFDCRTGFLKSLCSRVLYNIGPQEGLYVENQTLYVVKDKTQRLEMLLKGNSSKINQLRNLSTINKVLAAEKILFPILLEELEREKIYGVKIIVIDGSGKNIQIVGRFGVETSYYRRFEIEDYNRAYISIKSMLNFSDFQSKLSRYISEE